MANIIQQFKNANGDNIYPVAYAQGGMKMDLLWTNPSPTSSFSAQTVSVDLSSYSFVYIVYMQVTTNTSFFDSKVLMMGGNGELYSRLGGYISFRHATVSANGIVFMDGARQNSFGDNYPDNTRSIPYQIYGIKTSYVVPTSVHGIQYVEV